MTAGEDWPIIDASKGLDQRLGASGFARCTASNLWLEMRRRSSFLEDRGRISISLEFTHLHRHRTRILLWVFSTQWVTSLQLQNTDHEATTVTGRIKGCIYSRV